VALIGITVLLARSTRARPSSATCLDRRGEARRGASQVRGLGTLVPKKSAGSPRAPQAGSTRSFFAPAHRSRRTGDLMLAIPTSNRPRQRRLALQAAEAELPISGTLQSGVLAADSAAASAKADFEQTRLRAEVNEALLKDGLVSKLEAQLRSSPPPQAATRNGIEQKRFAFAQDSTAPQLAVEAGRGQPPASQAKLRHDELDALTVARR